MKSIPLALALSALTATSALAQDAACTLAGAAPVPEIEALNALVLAGDFDGLFTAMAARMPDLAPDLLVPMKAAYPQPFATCTTLVQRVEVGGLSQHVVLFEGQQPLFVYWASANMGGQNGLVLFNMDSSFGAVFDMLR